MKKLSSPYAIFLLLVILTSSTLPTQSLAQSSPSIVVFGDSLSAGYGLQINEDWPTLLQNHLRLQGYPHPVHNLSISGETTQGGLLRLPKALQQYNPTIVILELGANDGLRGQSLSQMQGNLQQMIDASHNIDALVILTGMHIPPNYGKRYSEGFYRVFLKLAQQEGVMLIPFLLENIATVPGLIQNDGLHPTAEAQTIILDNVWKTLKPLLQVPEEDGRLNKQ